MALCRSALAVASCRASSRDSSRDSAAAHMHPRRDRVTCAEPGCRQGYQAVKLRLHSCLNSMHGVSVAAAAAAIMIAGICCATAPVPGKHQDNSLGTTHTCQQVEQLRRHIIAATKVLAQLTDLDIQSPVNTIYTFSQIGHCKAKHIGSQAYSKADSPDNRHCQDLHADLFALSSSFCC